MERKREVWVDYIKVFACILVVLGHFFQSMTKSNILPANDVYHWFDTTVYYFHVPLFFICSGYLYQKLSRVDSFERWKRNVLKKLITFGIPYFTFSIVTWVLKTAFSSSVNDQLGGIIETLLMKPASPYWYLYCLFLLFLVTPTINGTKSMIYVVGVAVIGRVIALSGVDIPVYAVSVVLINEIWFVSGMILACEPVRSWFMRQKPLIGWITVCLFAATSVFAYVYELGNGIVALILGMMACIGFLLMFISMFKKENKVMDYLSKYTMPIFLMHTIFAASVRAVLLKIGIQNGVIHMVIGLGISFVGPIIAAEVMKRIKCMEFFLYPGKYIKLK